MMKKLDIIFMGTPSFGVAILAALIKEHDVKLVVTQTDKVNGKKVYVSPVKELAIQEGIEVFQPVNIRKDYDKILATPCDLIVTAAYGQIIGTKVLAHPRYASINVHGSLLPRYRGGAPIQRSIINGDKETGITTFFLDENIDTGRIILQERIPIGEEDCLEDIHDRMMIQGADLVQRTVDLIAEGKAEAIDQEQFMTDEPLRPAPKIFKETCEIKWTSTEQVYNFVRGLSPYPAAWTTLHTQEGKELVMKIFKSKKETALQDIEEPTLQTDGKTFMRIALPDGYLYLTEVQISGKKRMQIADFLRGAHIEGWTL